MVTIEQEHLNNLRHSCAHLLAAAVMKLWPDTKRTIGPAIDDGFYFDFEFQKPITEADLPKIEAKMREILPSWAKFERHELSEQEAKKEYENNIYKHEIIEEITGKGETITFYKSGDYWDLCRGGHVDNPAHELKHFKLLSLAGAYWRGSEKNQMLTRIYGTCFPTKDELDKYLWQQEEAKKRDHKKIGRELDLFSFHEEGPGFVFWHPKGLRMRQPLLNFWQEVHDKAGYEEVSTPIALSDSLWKQSGHWQNYKDNMYFTKADNKTYALKPMNCPGMILIYKNRPHSYRELPIKWRELGLVHRHEPSGTLNGLFRQRAFRQDDAHIFLREDQIEKEVKEVIELALSVYKVFHFENIQIELSTRPAKSIGSDAVWEKAESMLLKALTDLKLDYKLNKGDGAFYGPKIDFHLQDSLGRLWQCGTIQLDFAMPERFKLIYTDSDGKEKQPVMIHRAIFGSVHRFFGILIEHYAGAFPLWLSPLQILLIPIADRHAEHAQGIFEKLRNAGIRAQVDDRSESMQAKIRDATLQKTPYMGIIGDKEMAGGDLLSIRTREGKDLGQVKLNELISKLQEEISLKK